MRLYVMDTDIAGFAFQKHIPVVQRIQSLPEDDLVVTTIITFGEDLGGLAASLSPRVGWCDPRPGLRPFGARTRFLPALGVPAV